MRSPLPSSRHTSTSKTMAAVGAPRFEPEAYISSIPCSPKSGNTSRRIDNKKCERDALSQKRSQKTSPTHRRRTRQPSWPPVLKKQQTQQSQKHFSPENPKYTQSISSGSQIAGSDLGARTLICLWHRNQCPTYPWGEICGLWWENLCRGRQTKETPCRPKLGRP